MPTQTYSYIAFHSTTKKAELEGHLSLDNLKSRLRKLDVERLKIVHFLFMRQHDGLSRDYKYDMDTHLMITNYMHGLFGCGCELDFCSLTADMICDREEQYGGYQNLSEDIMCYEFDDC